MCVRICRVSRRLHNFKILCNVFGIIPAVDSTNDITQGVVCYYYYGLQFVVYLLLNPWFKLSVVAFCFRLLIPSILHLAFYIVSSSDCNFLTFVFSILSPFNA
jgi:hypothetical protein